MYEQAKNYYQELRTSNCSDTMLARAEQSMIESAKHLENMRIQFDENRTFPNV